MPGNYPGISGPETAFVVLHDQAIARTAQRRPGAEHRARPVLPDADSRTYPRRTIDLYKMSRTTARGCRLRGNRKSQVFSSITTPRSGAGTLRGTGCGSPRFAGRSAVDRCTGLHSLATLRWVRITDLQGRQRLGGAMADRADHSGRGRHGPRPMTPRPPRSVS